MNKLLLILLGLCISLILQAQVSKTVNITAGGLAAALTATEKNTITNLTITGTIDARDFDIMCDSMPVLANLNLKAVSITAFGQSKSNQIPGFTFNAWGPEGVGKKSLKTIVLPLNLKDIGQHAFDGCSGLTGTFIIPPSVVTIGCQAFMECTGLESVSIPSSVTSMDCSVFMLCSGSLNVDPDNPTYSSLDGVLYNKDKTTIITCPISKTGGFIIPASVTTIDENAFYDCDGLTSVAIPSSVKTILLGAFQNCYNLSGTLTIPSSVTAIERDAFKDCRHLDSVIIPSTLTIIKTRAFDGISGYISVDPDNPAYSSMDGVLFNKDQSSLMQCPTSKSGSYNIPSTVKIIEYDAFRRCYNLTNINIPGSVISIGLGAFNFCTAIKSVYIPSSVSFIGQWAFAACTGLSSIYADIKSPINLLDPNFASVDKIKCILYVPFKSKQLYENAYLWKDFKNIVEMPGFSLSDTTIIIPDNGGSDFAIILSNTTWTVASDQQWLTVSAASGTGNDSLVFTAVANPSSLPRIALVTVSAEGVPDQTITFLQEAAAATITVLEKNVSIGPDEGSTASAKVTSNDSWTTISDQQWLTISSAKGTGNGTLIFTAVANPSILPRVATVTVSSEGLAPQTITITQEAFYTSATVLVSPTLVIIAADEGSTASVIIAAKLPWTATSDETWFTINPGNGPGNDTLIFTAKANLSSYDRPARVNVSTTDDYLQTITVIQLAKFRLSAVEIPKENITLFPNPVTDGFRINGLEGKATLTVSDLSGKQLLSKEIDENEYIPTSQLAKGMYIIRIINYKGRIDRMLVKE